MAATARAAAPFAIFRPAAAFPGGLVEVVAAGLPPLVLEGADELVVEASIGLASEIALVPHLDWMFCLHACWAAALFSPALLQVMKLN